jgi:hypothetical protein
MPRHAISEALARSLRQVFLDRPRGDVAVAATVEIARGRGRTEHYAPVALPLSCAPGAIARVRVTGSTGDMLVAEGAERERAA